MRLAFICINRILKERSHDTSNSNERVNNISNNKTGETSSSGIDSVVVTRSLQGTEE